MANRLRQIPEEFQYDPPGSSPAPQAVEPGPDKVVPHHAPDSAFATTILLTSLKALSQRALVALGQLFVLAAAASAFWLWYTVLPQPSVYQLIGLGLYGLLMLAMVHLVIRK